MNAKRLSLAMAALVAAGGLWLAVSARRSQALQNPNMSVGVTTPQGLNSDPNNAASLPTASQTGPTPGPNGGPESGQLNPPAQLAPPVPNRRFTDYTPEQRVQFARQGHGPGG